MSRMNAIEKALIKAGRKAVDGVAEVLDYTDSLLQKGRDKPRAKKKGAKKKAVAKQAAGAKKKAVAKTTAVAKRAKKTVRKPARKK